MPVAGLVRLRQHNFGRQSVANTKVAAKRAYAYRGVPNVDLGWTDPEVDAGSLDETVAPYRAAGDFTAPLTCDALRYNELPLRMCGFFGGGVTPTGGGAAKTWLHEPASTAPLDEPDYFTYEMGDDVVTDWFQLGDGVLESVEFTAPVGLGPLTTSDTWRFGSASSTGSTDSPVTGTVPTPALSLEPNEAYVYLKDIAIYIADDPDYLASNQISDALYSFVLRLSGDFDQKRWANGDQSFDIDELVRATRMIELEATWAKTDDIVGVGSEADHWFSDQSVDRYVRILATSTVEAQPGVPYSWEVIMPMRYRTRTDGEEGGNTTVTLMGRSWFDPDEFEGVFSSEVVCTLAEADL
jgi:hypothetical protein